MQNLHSGSGINVTNFVVCCGFIFSREYPHLFGLVWLYVKIACSFCKFKCSVRTQIEVTFIFDSIDNLTGVDQVSSLFAGKAFARDSLSTFFQLILTICKRKILLPKIYMSNIITQNISRPIKI